MTRTTPRAQHGARLLLLAATALLTACGSGTTPSGGSSPTDSTPGPVSSSSSSAPTSTTPSSTPPTSPTPIVPSHPVTFPPPTGAATPPPTATGPTPIVPSHPVTFPPSSQATPTTLTGTMIEGTRPTCHILQAGGKRYSLTGRPALGLRVGDRVTVEGSARPHLMSSCGGVTFVVTRSQLHS